MFERGSVLVLVVGIHEQSRVAGRVFVCCWKKKKRKYCILLGWWPELWLAGFFG
jgi:hypothetical protein